MASTPGLKQRLPLLLSLAGVAAGLLWLYFLDHRFFFMDDRQAQYFPYGLIIRDALLRGEFPFLTTHTFYGGALWLDWQYGLYNPSSLLMDMMIDPRHLEFSGLLFALVSNLLLALGAYALGRSYGLTRGWAALLGLLMGLNIYIVYRNSNIWQPGVTSLAWMMFAWAALKQLIAAKKNIALRVLLAALYMYMMVSAGWPHTDIAFALIAAALFIEERLKDKNGPSARRLVAAGLLGAALCLPVVVPVLAALPWTARGAIQDPPMFHPRLTDTLNVGNPVWQTFMSQGSPGQQPLLYLAWFALPALVLIRWKAARWQRLLPLACLAWLFFILADAGAGALLTLRYPLRWAPFFHLCLLLPLLALLQDSPLVLSRRRILWAFALLTGPMLLAFGLHPDSPPPAFAAALAACGALTFWIWKPRQTLTVLAASSLLVFGLIFLAYPGNNYSIEWGKHDETAAAALEAARTAPLTYTFTDSTYSGYSGIPAGAPAEQDFMIAAMGAYFHADTLNGYSSLGQKGLEELTHCSLYEVITCSYHTDTLLKREPETGVPYLDLFKVGRIVATKKDGTAASVRQQAPRGWKESDRPLVAIFDRQKKIELPGTLSWHSPSVTVSEPAQLADDREMFQIKNGTKPGLLVFARLYYPGFHAAVDDKALPVRPVNDLLVGINVPAGAAGKFVLSFTPPLLWPCVTLSAFALLGWLVFAWRERATA